MTKPEVPGGASFVRFHTEHPQPNTIQHWQLRDLLAVSHEDAKMLYTVEGSRVCRFNLQSRMTETYATCNQAATSMTVGSDYLATGTDHGLLTIYNISNAELPPQRIFEETIAPAGDVLNSLHIVSPGHNHPARIYASLNDTTIRCYTLPNMRPQATLKHDDAVNYCAESPDGSTLVSVGDTHLVNIFHRDSTGNFVLTGKLRSDARDAGMCCQWNQWGSCFATAHQCGHVLVWDPRLPSDRTVASHEVGSAVRTVKFCESPVDLLAFAEHDAAFHVVDARKYRVRQTVRHLDNQNAGISGMAFAPGGSKLYIGVENRGIQEWSVDSMSRRGFSGYLAS